MLQAPRPRLLSWLALLGLALALPGCDNPACVFGGNCFGNGGNGALGANPASVPSNNEWISAAAPQVERVAPTSSSSVDSRTPIVVVFSESMSPSGITTAFQLQTSAGVPAPCTTALIGDGRVLVLLPVQPLQAGEQYSLGYNTNVTIQDRNGQALVIPTQTELLSLTVAGSDSNTPKLVTTWPLDGALSQSAKGELLAFFDRPLDANTLDTSSFRVLVDGALPSPNPDPALLTLSGGLQTEGRVVRWRYADASGNPLSLGLDKPVSFEISPTGHALEDADGHAVQNSVTDYRTAAFGAPTAVAITSEPSDAIGLDALSGPANLAIQVTLAGAQQGDQLGFFLFGTDPTVAQQPPLISLGRSVALSAPFTDFTLTAEEIDLVASAAPFRARLADGSVNLAVQLRRGNLASPITLLDTDATKSGVQAPLLDTVAPVLTGLSTSGTGSTSLSSNLRDLVVIGRASESIRAATVTTALGDNLGGGTAAPAVSGSHSSGLFVAQPVPLGVIDPADLPLDFQLTIYDRALNHVGPLTASFRQVGACGPGNSVFSQITLHVFDAATLAPIVGAHVHTHEDLGGILLSIADFDTDANGDLTIEASQLGETVLTVDASDQGYELFTFDGVTVDRVEVPLAAQTQAAATVEGSIASTNAQVALTTGGVGDSRRVQPNDLFAPVHTCTFQTNVQHFECSYDPVAIASRRIGGISAFATLPPASLLLYTPLGFLKGAAFEVPVPPASPGAIQTQDLSYPALMDEASLSNEERAIDAPAQILGTTFYPNLLGDPLVSVEGLSPGIPGTLQVGAGLAFPDGLPAGSFTVRAAYPGSVDGIQDDANDELGSLVQSGTIEADLRLRVQVSDIDGNTAGVRPRFSAGSGTVDPPAPPALGVVPIDLDVAGLSYNLSFTDVLPDADAQVGLYRVTVTDSAGKRWVVWRTDRPDAAGGELLVHLPFVASGTTFPLAAGDLDCHVALFAWPSFDATNFLWTDIEREYDRFAFSTTLTVTPP